MPAAREIHQPAAALWLSAALAVGVHFGVLTFWRIAPNAPPRIEVEGDSVEVALVESAPAAPAPESVPEPPAPEPPPPEPEIIPPKEPPEMILPAPPIATPAPKPRATPKPAAKPSARPNPIATPAAGGTTSAGGNGAGKPGAKSAFIVRPAAAYPPESRAAGEQGVVILRIIVNADGRPTAVSVARGSGFPRLDRAAVEGGWRSRVSNAVAGAQFDAPVRFNLRD